MAAVGEHFGARLGEAEAEQPFRLLSKLAPA
jgi:hypothetical protein